MHSHVPELPRDPADERLFYFPVTLPLTPHMLAAAYDYLRETPPFRRWKLPESDAVEFHVTRHRDRYGDAEVCKALDKCMRVSSANVTDTDTLMQTIGHELIHMHLDGRAAHGPRFLLWAKRACDYHGWDMRKFV